ncbi:Mrp/NBP35 family ATP-binding protein [Gemmatimonadota bacterium]
MSADTNRTGPTPEAVLETLSSIQDPDLGKDIVSLGFIKNLEIDGGTVAFTIELTTPACPAKDLFVSQARELVGQLEGVEQVDVSLGASQTQPQVQPQNLIPGVSHTIAVASGKGGVGKSTIAANLALALARDGAKVGLMDADIYGPSIPIMFGINERPDTTGEGNEGNRIIPLEKYGIKLMSLGFLADERMPVIWRGPLVGKMVQEFLERVEWGELDYLVVDLPPGTGDAQLTLVQSAPLSGAVVVTTPQEVALEDVVRALRMFERVNVHILGLVENMAYFTCDGCGKQHNIFSSGGGRRTATQLGIPFVGEVPLEGSVCEGGDAGTPAIIADPDSAVSQVFMEMARAVAANASIVSMREGISQRELAEISEKRQEG